MRRSLIFSLLASLWCAIAHAAETLPPEPTDHVTDYATLIAPGKLVALETELAQFERDTSNRICVAIYPSLPPDAALEEFTARLFQSWGGGEKGRKNGAVLFIFAQDRKVRVVAGEGLKATLSDAMCARIVEDELAPRFRNGEYGDGVTSAVHALLAATRGDYHGSGKAAGSRRVDNESGDLGVGGFGLIIFAVVGVSLLREFFRRTVVYSRDGRRTIWSSSGSSTGGGGGGAGGSW